MIVIRQTTLHRLLILLSWNSLHTRLVLTVGSFERGLFTLSQSRRRGTSVPSLDGCWLICVPRALHREVPDEGTHEAARGPCSIATSYSQLNIPACQQSPYGCNLQCRAERTSSCTHPATDR